ncbi:hypothetical protein [Roseibacillus ishigakijimensis]|nr:hypothetical protein [Roseibacillus ishigakijimensis]
MAPNLLKAAPLKQEVSPHERDEGQSSLGQQTPLPTWMTPKR